MKHRIYRLNHTGMEAYIFTCPGCTQDHMVPVSHTDEYATQCRKVGRSVSNWAYNGSMSRPTFNPSLLVTGTRMITDEERDRIMNGEKLEIPTFVCHSFIRDGRIEFLGDCTHELKNQTVDLAEVEE